jgi:hypothetical protein
MVATALGASRRNGTNDAFGVRAFRVVFEEPVGHGASARLVSAAAERLDPEYDGFLAESTAGEARGIDPEALERLGGLLALQGGAGLVEQADLLA